MLPMLAKTMGGDAAHETNPIDNEEPNAANIQRRCWTVN